MTAEFVPKRKAGQLAKHLRKVLQLFVQGGFIVDVCHMDQEFIKVRDFVGTLEVNTTAAREHVGQIERLVHLLKEQIWCISSDFPFELIPTMLLTRTVYQAILMLNAFYMSSGIAGGYSPRELVQGTSFSLSKECKAPVGACVEASQHEE